MRSPYLTLSAVGATPWVPIDWTQPAFSLGVGVVLSEDAALTYTVQHTFDPLGVDYAMPVKLARAAGVVTATVPYQHGLSAGDSFNIWSSGSSQMDSQPAAIQPGPPWTSGGNQVVAWAPASVPSTTTLTYAVTNAGPTADNGTAKIQILRVFPHPILTALAVRQYGNYANQPITAVRLILITCSAGFAQLEVIQGIDS